MINFDLISDIHLDFWIKYSGNYSKLEEQMDEFIQSILPDSPSNILVIAGDLGHFNQQNFIFINKMMEIYKNILIVAGNHDYYLESKSIKNKYRKNSLNRWNEMRQFIQRFSNVMILDGTLVEIDNINFGGCGMWYDFQYGYQVLKASELEVFNHWKSVSNDSVLIEGKPRLVELMFQEEKQKLNQVLYQSDVIVTHFSPDWAHVPIDRAHDLATSFYYFDGREFFNQIKNKIWCFGHVHKRMDYMHYDCRFVNASLGYPGENKGLPSKIINVNHYV
ncbi:metallophosphoesterase family protein [Paenibacillus sedimenti]|uniref:Metallophosphoesterase n=1 Tax=Paenibacillus sedimenti TaxID=2770274 RepID=A0A926KRQ3_9BACL|nr:metallophosphoesterase [Paenibacillus sedimenti]MBD0380984.1 metallophosphoesterase [Paenibacillus sedimenti]